MKIVADEKIPLIKHYFSAEHELILKNGRALVRQDMLTADLLIVRSVTHVDHTLLHDTPVKFVGSVTAGADHIDLAWLKQAGIYASVAYGCNAVAVAEYVLAVIAVLQKNNFLVQKKPRAGVVGVGKVGRQVVGLLQALNFAVFQCDPLRAEKEKDFFHTPLEKLTDLDLITLHTPLTKTGHYPTFHMINKLFLQRQKAGCVLLSAGRGSVINFQDLFDYGKNLIWCLDVWENEPLIDLKLLKIALIATPHIAGHSIQSKYRAIDMVYQAIVQKGFLSAPILPPHFPKRILSFKGEKIDWREVVLRVDDPASTTALMKKNIVLRGHNEFDILRNQFYKDEFRFVTLENAKLNKFDETVLQKCGIGLI